MFFFVFFYNIVEGNFFFGVSVLIIIRFSVVEEVIDFFFDKIIEIFGFVFE